MWPFSSTESPDLSRLGNVSPEVRLSGHSTIDLSQVEYSPADNAFYFGDLDVTANVNTAQRLAFPSYADTGIQHTNLDNYVEKTGDTTSGGSTDTLGLFVDGVKQDAVDIANSVRTFVGGDPSNIGGMSDLKKLVYVAIFAGLLYLVWKIATVIKAKP